MSNRPFAAAAVCALLFALCVTPAGALGAANPPGMPPRGKVLLGMGGTGTTMASFAKLADAPHEIHLISPPWGQTHSNGTYSFQPFMDAGRDGGYRVMVHLDAPEDSSFSPMVVARGGKDALMIDMSRVLNERDEFVYVRPPAEMNGHWSNWAAFRQSGAPRPAAYATRQYRGAFIRIAEVFRGGSVAGINARLKRQGLPPLRTNAKLLPSSGRVMLVWNPQAEGSPNVRGNQPIDFYPGAAWVDYVATDIYEQNGRAAWAQNESFYRQFAKRHPFMVAEYAPWGYDGASFVSRMFAWAKSHPRTVALMYFNGTSSTRFSLATKPKSRAAYRSLARGAVFRCPGFSPTRNVC